MKKLVLNISNIMIVLTSTLTAFVGMAKADVTPLDKYDGVSSLADLGDIESIGNW